MSIFRNISVKAKITLIIIGVSLVTLGITILFLMVSQNLTLKRELSSRAIRETELICEYFIMPIVLDATDKGNEIVLNIMNNQSILCARVSTKNGREFVSYCRDNVEIDIDYYDKSEPAHFKGNYLIVYLPIKRESNILGHLEVLYYTGLKDGNWTKVLFSLLIIAGIIIVNLLLALHFQKYISEPILKLASIAKQIAKSQKYDITIEKTSNDELGELIDSLNQMLSAINLREAERDEIMMAYASNEEKLRNIFNSGLDGILLTDLNGYILEASDMACTILGIVPEPLLRKRLAEYMPKAYENERGNIIQELRRDGNTTFVTKFFKNDKTEIYLEFSSRLIQIEGKERCLSYIRDITQKLLAEEDLKESEERYKMLVEHFPSAILLHRNNEIIFVNEAITSILGGEEKHDYHGRNIQNFIHSESIGIIDKQFEHVRKYAQVSERSEIYMEHANGTLINVEIITIPINFNRRKTLLSVVNDITQRKQIEGELILAKNRAEESDKLKSAFLANMSHEIRTPMNGIIGFADLLSKENVDVNDIKKYVNLIKVSADRLLNIINDIIDISKIESGAINIVNEDFVLNTLIIELADFFKPAAEKKGLEFKLTINTNENIILHSDRNKINQILTNLISNSIKFTNKGFITLKCEIDLTVGHVSISVCDTGVGIPKSQQKEIFERFRQANNYIQDFNEGTGLGLSISRGFADALGGNIMLESDENKGAKFILQIPFLKLIRGSNQIISSKKKESIIDVNLSEKTILLAEDEEINSHYIENLLAPTDVKLIVVRNGLLAVQKIHEQPDIDLILMDIKLPIMNGFTAAKRIKSINENIPIVAQTAYGMEEDKDRIVNGCCDDYLSKPISEKEFFRVINKFLGE